MMVVMMKDGLGAIMFLFMHAYTHVDIVTGSTCVGTDSWRRGNMSEMLRQRETNITEA